MTYPAYEKYKESGVPWLGQVPDGWRVKPLSLMTNIYTGYAFSSEDFQDSGAPLIRISDINRNGEVDLSDAKFLPEEYKEEYSSFLVNSGEVVMAMTGATIGKAGKYKYIEPSLLNQRVCKFSSNKKDNPSFVWYLLNAAFYSEHIFLTAFGGAQPNISDKQLVECKVPTPSLPEQKAIAEFLDRKTAEIDALVAKKQELLKLLTEQRTALITHAVTKGLDPSAPMKDSGIDWLGHIPQHWEAKRLKYVISIQNGRDYKELEADSGYPVIGSGGQFTFASDYLYDGEAILLGRKGTIDKPLYINQRFWTVDTMYYGIPLKENIGRFLYFCALTIPFSLYATDTALPSMTQSKLDRHIFAIPPLEEQRKILDYVDVKLKHIDGVVEKTIEAIDRLKEYRTALITNAVTGKIKVV